MKRQDGMTFEEFKTENNLNLYSMFECSLEGTGRSTDDPDAFEERLRLNAEDIYEEIKKSF